MIRQTQTDMKVKNNLNPEESKKLKKKNKKTTAIIVLLISLIVVTAALFIYFKNNVKFKGVIIDINENSIGILKENKENNSYSIVYSSLSDFKIWKLKVGDVVTVTYNGVEMESFPAQISIKNLKVENNDNVVVSNVLKTYLKAIEDVNSRFFGKIKTPKYLNLDIKSAAELTIEEKSYLLKQMSTYDDKIKGLDKSLGLSDDKDATGTFITIDSFSKVNDNDHAISISKMLSPSKYVTVKLLVSYKDNEQQVMTLEYLEHNPEDTNV